MNISELLEEERKTFSTIPLDICKYIYQRLKSSTPIEYSKVSPVSLSKILVDIHGLKEFRELVTKLFENLKKNEGKYLVFYIAPFGGSKSQTFEYVKEIVKKIDSSHGIIEFSFSASTRIFSLLKTIVLTISALLLSSNEIIESEKEQLLEILAEYRLAERKISEEKEHVESLVDEILPIISSLIDIVNKKSWIILIQVDECDLWYGNYSKYKEFGKLFREIYDRASRVLYIFYTTTEAYYQLRKWSAIDPFLNRTFSGAFTVASPGKYLDKVSYAVAKLAALIERVKETKFSPKELNLVHKVISYKKLDTTLDIRRCNLMIISLLEKIMLFNKYKLFEIGEEKFKTGEGLEIAAEGIISEVLYRIPGIIFIRTPVDSAEGYIELSKGKIPVKIIASDTDIEALNKLLNKYSKIIVINLIGKDFSYNPKIASLNIEFEEILYPLVGIICSDQLTNSEREKLFREYADFFRSVTELDSLMESEVIELTLEEKPVEEKIEVPEKVEEVIKVSKEDYLSILLDFIQSWRSIRSVCKFLKKDEKYVRELVEKYRKYFYIKGSRIYRRK